MRALVAPPPAFVCPLPNVHVTSVMAPGAPSPQSTGSRRRGPSCCWPASRPTPPSSASSSTVCRPPPSLPQPPSAPQRTTSPTACWRTSRPPSCTPPVCRRAWVYASIRLWTPPSAQAGTWSPVPSVGLDPRGGGGVWVVPPFVLAANGPPRRKATRPSRNNSLEMFASHAQFGVGSGGGVPARILHREGQAGVPRAARVPRREHRSASPFPCPPSNRRVQLPCKGVGHTSWSC